LIIFHERKGIIYFLHPYLYPMKRILLDYTRYNSWANARVIEILKTLNDQALDQALGGSFSTIRNTVNHIWGAESIWYQRLMMAEHILIPHQTFEGNFEEACTAWLTVSSQFTNFVEKQFDDRSFEHAFSYKAMNKTVVKSTVYEAIHHTMNHSTFHRGQLIHYARLLGVTQIPSTDQITFFREQK